jgi:DNA-binding CsgD family transcriptional regulator
MAKTQSGPGRAWIRKMAAQFESGRFLDAARTYDENVGASPASTIMRARIWLKSAPPKAIELLLQVGLGKDRAIEAERNMLLGVAYSRIREYDAADEFLDRAVRARPNPEIADEIRYHRVRRYLLEMRMEDARAELELLGKSKRPTTRLRVLHLESFIRSQEERYTEQATCLVELLRELDPQKEDHVEMRAWATHSLAALARELYVPDALPIIERQLEGVAWPEDFAINRFQALKAVGWARALQGDYFNGFRYLKRASQIAPNTAWNVVALADRAYLARCINEPRWSRQNLDEAELLASEVDWHATKNEERVGLLLLAELFAPLDAAKASQYLAQHSDLPILRSPLVHYRFDDRLVGIADYCTGIVQAAIGNTRLALKALQRSRVAFEKYGYDWRAGRTVLAIYNITKDASLLNAAAERLRHYKSSWLGDEMRRASVVGRQVDLPPMQRRVFEGMCEGLTPAQIANRLDRAENTIRNHIKLVFKAFCVNSRPALLAEAARRGLM